MYYHVFLEIVYFLESFVTIIACGLTLVCTTMCFLKWLIYLEVLSEQKISMVLCLYVLARVTWNDEFSCKFCDNSYMYIPLCVYWNGSFDCTFCDNYHIVLVLKFYLLNFFKSLQLLCPYPTIIISNKGHISGLLFHWDIFLNPGSWCKILMTSMLCSLYEMDSGR